MNGIEKIIDRISGDAQVEIDAILNQAKAEAAEITAKYEAQAKAEADEILKRGAAAAAEREDRLASMAQMEGRKAGLAAKQEVVGEALGREDLGTTLNLTVKAYAVQSEHNSAAHPWDAAGWPAE